MRALRRPSIAPCRRDRGRLVALFAIALALAPAASAGAAARPLVFGIYPGGGAGTVGPAGETRPEVPELRRRSLLALRPAGRPFVVRLYDEYHRASDADAVAPWLASQIAGYASDGFKIELVLPYRPNDPRGDVDGFVRFVRARVAQLGPNPALTDLQVTNEVNITAAPAAADGSYPGALDALVRGVVAAGDAAGTGGFRQLRVGFSWADQPGPSQEAFFASLRERGGAPFAAAVDWVGADAYPGTWGPALPAGRLATAVRRATIRTMRRLRRELMPRAGLRRARIHFSESGYPTGPGRTAAMQRTVMDAAIRTVARYRETYGVTDLRWFDLRDADSSNASFESQYGLTRDDYSPKPAFFTFRALVRRLR
jgi:hypothetical protein